MSQITIPYSMVADTTSNIRANGVHVDDNFNTLVDAVNIKLSVDGTDLMQANLNMNTHKVTNLLAGTNPGDAINKSQLDAAVGSIGLATTSSAGLVQIGNNVNINSGVISVNDATTSAKGVIQLGRTNTIANAGLPAVRQSIITNTVPTSGEDGIIYYVYAL
jgi:phage-related baseplate assembly protein